MKSRPKQKEEKPNIIFRTEMGDFDVTLFSTEGKRKYFLAQQAINDLKALTVQCELKKISITSLHNDIQENECIAGCQIETPEED
jgi:hypothetical protein